MTSKFRGKLARTFDKSEPWWPENTRQERHPNVVTVILDDTGWSDFGCFGSEIRTPTIDGLAEEGLRYSNFHVTPLCSPTRAALMTGRNHHRVGMRCLADTDTGFPNGRGCIPEDTPLLATLLRERGYGTYMTGKWHLTPAHEMTPAGPFTNWPVNRGFDRYYGFLGGCTDHYAPEICQDNHAQDPDLKPGYHLTEDLCDRAIQYLRDHVSFRKDAPFYLNLAFGATHAPIQVERRYIDPYVPVFEKGWDRTRADRLARQKALGIVPENTELAARNPEVPAWDSLSDDQKTVYTRLQAAYAGFLEHADSHLGRVVSELERLGLRDDTIIIVMSDNGASREGGADGAVDTNAPYSGRPETVADMLEKLDSIGGPNGPAHYPQGWAMAGNTPFRRYKQFVELGGVRSPMVVSWPKGITQTGEVRDQFLHVIDIAPTLLGLSGDTDDLDFDGRSFSPTFNDRESTATRDLQYWEMFGRRAIYADGWKAIASHEKGDDYEADRWSLYDTRSDFSEAHDLAGEEPERLAALQAAWEQEASRNDVWPLDDRTIVDILQFRQPNGLMSSEEITLFPGKGHVPQISMVTATERSMEMTAQFSREIGPDDKGGVLLSSGDRHGGYSFYLLDGALHFEHVRVDQRVRISARPDRPFRQCSAVLHVADDQSASVILFADRKRLGEGKIPLVSLHLSFWGLDTGRDAGIPVSDHYQAPFAFDDATLDRIVLRFFETHAPEEVAALLETTE
ncbi:arylsulfatase [Martelella sp. HB161492]|uniref:arylsulfatase n=1 Tax=Martelella sp. HB161492 TaxID=2720726 RepID=UPI0015921420|nr:arylsulfatase [Martelella sp. HB161492]